VKSSETGMVMVDAVYVPTFHFDLNSW